MTKKATFEKPPLEEDVGELEVDAGMGLGTVGLGLSFRASEAGGAAHGSAKISGIQEKLATIHCVSGPLRRMGPPCR